MTKKELRFKYKALRQELSVSQIEDYSLAIANQLLKLNIWDKSVYHIFLSITELKNKFGDFPPNSIIDLRDVVTPRPAIANTKHHCETPEKNSETSKIDISKRIVSTASCNHYFTANNRQIKNISGAWTI